MLLYSHNEGRKPFEIKKEPQARKEDPMSKKISAPIVNSQAATIELTKSFAAAASKYGTKEYRMLQEARRDYPDFKVVTNARSGGRHDYKGLTYDYMEIYIENHDDEKKSIMATFKTLRAEDDDLSESLSYADIKDWFLEQFPEIADFHNQREKTLNAIRAKREEARKDKKNAAADARRNALRARLAV